MSSTNHSIVPPRFLLEAFRVGQPWKTPKGSARFVQRYVGPGPADVCTESPIPPNSHPTRAGIDKNLGDRRRATLELASSLGMTLHDVNNKIVSGRMIRERVIGSVGGQLAGESGEVANLAQHPFGARTRFGLDLLVVGTLQNVQIVDEVTDQESCCATGGLVTQRRFEPRQYKPNRNVLVVVPRVEVVVTVQRGVHLRNQQASHCGYYSTLIAPRSAATTRRESRPSTEGKNPMTRFIDATQPLHDGTPAIHPLPPVKISWLLQMSAGAPLNVSLLTTATHAGTHVDAPSHAIPGGLTIDQIPPERFIRPCLVIDVNVSGDQEISADALRTATDGQLRVGDALIISTGWGELFGTDEYREHPAIGVDAAKWMVEEGVDMVGVDLITVDAPVSRRTAGFDFPVHRTLLGNDVLIIENLVSLRGLFTGRGRLHALPLPLAGRDAAQARVLIEV